MQPKNLSQLKVLYVEDEVLIALDGEEILRNLGFDRVTVAMTFQDAQTMIDRDDFDLALLDINLGGGKTSLSLVDALRSKGVTVLLLSGYTQSQGLEKRLQPPTIGKPFDEQTLHRAIMSALTQARDMENESRSAPR